MSRNIASFSNILDKFDYDLTSFTKSCSTADKNNNYLITMTIMSPTTNRIKQLRVKLLFIQWLQEEHYPLFKAKYSFEFRDNFN